MSGKVEPRSYLDPQEREALRQKWGMNFVYLEESSAADDAGDAASSWAWLARAELPAEVLRYLKRRHGADFIRRWGFSTQNADRVHGPGWLDRE